MSKQRERERLKPRNTTDLPVAPLACDCLVHYLSVAFSYYFQRSKITSAAVMVTAAAAAAEYISIYFY